jgi:cephalosporin-C deacetylase-like acetyl esterase
MLNLYNYILVYMSSSNIDENGVTESGNSEGGILTPILATVGGTIAAVVLGYYILKGVNSNTRNKTPKSVTFPKHTH